MLKELCVRVCEINLALKRAGLVIQTWGNASAIDREQGLVVIKPSGVAYDQMRPEDMVVVDLDGNTAAGTLQPSVDLPVHLALYKGFTGIGGVIHTHAHYATCFAQARREIACLGTTHADYFYGAVPIVGAPGPEETRQAYEHHTGMAIVRQFDGRMPLECPAALVAGHGPFTWGADVEEAFENAVVLEELARMALHTGMIRPDAPPLEAYLLDKHFLRKHGKGAYYGQRADNR